MRTFRQWLLTLGVAALTPGIVAAGPLSLMGAKKPAAKASKPAGRQSGPPKTENQKAADGIAAALRKANFSGHDIQIEFNGGVARLSGMVSDPRQKALATEVVSRIPIVRNVDNQLTMMGQPVSPMMAAPAMPAAAPIMQAAAPRQAVQTAAGVMNHRPVMQQTGGNSADPPFLPAAETAAAGGAAPSNQQVAEQIAAALSSANLSGYDIEIRYKNGTASLLGSVGSDAQRAAATQVVAQVPGVQMVDNRLGLKSQMAGAPAGHPFAGGRPMPMVGTAGGQMPVQSVGYQPPPEAPAGPPAAIPPDAVPPGMVGPYGPPGMPVPPSYGHPGSGAAYPVYNQPHLPEYAWPSYASYPNSAQVSYPTQYSASAWPYIGPFYPYPQVPLGWRQVQLEWDDGYWNLNFKPRTDKWWWFLHPKNWE
jgi:osmotically-inducible protein OsmY